MLKLGVIPEFANENKQFFKLPEVKTKHDHFKRERKPIEQSVADSIIDEVKKKATQRKLK
ncbi:hypothetical protein [Brevibacillus parabrevis]|jgi:hypothetical protein|uniref:hypothetical protein n=1 Tax=Brevibacillus parabrevis TaxID=54914 RepID=UPI002493A71E|nr:hypothetical protein [Brevibacillus parabrevis]